MSRVFVTGIGIISPLGLDTRTTWTGIKNGKSGISPISCFDASELHSRIAGEIRGFDPSVYLDRKTIIRMDRFAQFAIIATREAMSNARLDPQTIDPFRSFVSIGTSIGAVHAVSKQHETLQHKGIQRLSPLLTSHLLNDLSSVAVSMDLGLHCEGIGINAACAGGATAIGLAAQLMWGDIIECAIAGGSEAPICPFVVGGFDAMGALSRSNSMPERASRPFDTYRDGFVVSEGAAILILENEHHVRKRKIDPIAEVVAYTGSSDAYHISAPEPHGFHMSKTIERALERGGINPREIDYINAHGTGTRLNDVIETRAIKQVFGSAAKEIPISSTKSMTGHLIGASGALEAAITILSIRDDIIPPTINLDNPDPECDLDYVPNHARESTIRKAISLSSGFGGHNTVLVFNSPSQEW